MRHEKVGSSGHRPKNSQEKSWPSPDYQLLVISTYVCELGYGWIGRSKGGKYWSKYNIHTALQLTSGTTVYIQAVGIVPGKGRRYKEAHRQGAKITPFGLCYASE